MPCNIFKFKPAKSQEKPGQINQKATEQLIKLGYFAGNEDGETVLYDRIHYTEKFCSKNPCIVPSYDPQELINNVKADRQFLPDLFDGVYNEGYAPFEALLPYFPEIVDLDEYKAHIARGGVYPRSGLQAPLKQQIDEKTLAEVITKEGNQYGLAERDPVQILINVTNPIFGTRALINVITKDPKEVSDDERLNALLALTIVYGLGERITAHTAINLTKAIEYMRPLRASIKSGEAVPGAGVKDEARTWLKEGERTIPQSTHLW